MPTIHAPTDLCTVIVTLDADPGLMPELEAHARDGLARFGAFAGFVAGALHRSADGRRLVQYLQWAREEDHLACVNAPVWNTVPSSQRFMEIVESGRATLDVRTYTVVAAVPAG
ncbi:MAG: hypothetical protein OER21_12330 [Gemmatimonadota bacterium]|nr:hypothetical protein [Gemmatimonadota bacterium]